MVERQPSKLHTTVRSRSPAPVFKGYVVHALVLFDILRQFFGWLWFARCNAQSSIAYESVRKLIGRNNLSA